jgi:NitT/TauT family transport system substrate-binding protein
MSTYLLGKPGAETYAAGAVVSGELLKNRKDVAARYAKATARAIEDIKKDPSVRDVMVSDLNIPENIKADVPMPHFVMVKDLTEEQIGDFQKFIDVGAELGVVKAKVDVKTMLAR